MMLNQALTTASVPAFARLASLAPLSDTDMALLQSAAANSQRFHARREFVREGQAVDEPKLLLSGWACRTHTLSDGRRQIVGLILPGDVIGHSEHRNPVSPCSILALTEVVTCRAPAVPASSHHVGLAEAYALSKAWDEAYLMRNVTRLGRLSAYQRLADLLLEIYERLARADLVQGNTFAMPLTQETLADALGLTTVHVNRTIQSLRQDGFVTIGSRTVVLNDLAKLADLVERRPTALQSS